LYSNNYLLAFPWHAAVLHLLSASQAVPKYAGRFHKGSTHGLRAFGIAKLLEVKAAGNSKAGGGGAVPKSIKVQRFYRPEDVSRDLAYSSGLYDVLAPPSGSGSWVQWVDVDCVVGKCAVGGADQPAGEEGLGALGSMVQQHPFSDYQLPSVCLCCRCKYGRQQMRITVVYDAGICLGN
jgi:hypothetical protein